MKKVVLVEKNHLIRLGLQRLLGSLSAEWETMSLDVDALHHLPDTDRTADLVILGLPVDPYEGYQAVAAVERLLNPTRILLLSEHAASWSPTECGAGSIYACIDKRAVADTLIAAVQLGMSCENSPGDHAEADMVHELPLSPPQASPPLNFPGEARKRDDEPLSITPRQYEVLKLLARGYPIKTVARMMNIAVATAKAHTASLYRQLKVNSRGEAIYTARQKGVLLN